MQLSPGHINIAHTPPVVERHAAVSAATVLCLAFIMGFSLVEEGREGKGRKKKVRGVLSAQSCQDTILLGETTSRPQPTNVSVGVFLGDEIYYSLLVNSLQLLLLQLQLYLNMRWWIAGQDRYCHTTTLLSSPPPLPPPPPLPSPHYHQRPIHLQNAAAKSGPRPAAHCLARSFRHRQSCQSRLLNTFGRNTACQPSQGPALPPSRPLALSFLAPLRQPWQRQLTAIGL